MPYWSLSAYQKQRVKKAHSYVTSFETAVAQEAGKRGFQGVVCGHIHHAEIRNIDGLTYCNDGDWVESLSALAEDHNGILSLIRWEDRLLPKATGSKQISMDEALASVKSA